MKCCLFVLDRTAGTISVHLVGKGVELGVGLEGEKDVLFPDEQTCSLAHPHLSQLVE